jgi:hypothetical protein
MQNRKEILVDWKYDKLKQATFYYSNHCLLKFCLKQQVLNRELSDHSGVNHGATPPAPSKSNLAFMQDYSDHTYSAVKVFTQETYQYLLSFRFI